MNRFSKTTLWMLAGLLATSVATADLFESGVIAVNEAIPDNNEFGISDSLTVSGMAGGIIDISIALAISAPGGEYAYNGDFYAYLRHGNDDFAVLLNRIGTTDANPYGSWDDGLNVTFTLIGSDIHTAAITGGTLTGSWAADGRNIDPYSTGSQFDAAARTATLGAFADTDANGEWTLFVADLNSGGSAQLDSWSLDIQTVPEPAVVGLLGLSGVVMLIGRRFLRT